MTSVISVDAGALADETWDDPARGTLRWTTLFSAPRTPTDSLVCGIARMQPGEHFALHRHPHPEVYFGLAGEAEVLIDGQSHRLAPGIALYIPGNALHGVPRCEAPVSWFYTFAADSFNEIDYHFAHEAPALRQTEVQDD